MRNAAELRRDAEATGYFNGPKLQYVGDGYTIPWEVFAPILPPVGYTLATYKCYLDALDLEASRLHDWLYTPYGGLIAATRLEADSALREELLRHNPVDGEIVYAAVRLGGGLYFGTSQTGFAGFTFADQIIPVGGILPPSPNMPLAGTDLPKPPTPPPRRWVTMPIKCVIVYQMTTVPGVSDPALGYAGRSHIAGWTESWWWNGDVLADAVAATIGPRPGGLQALCYLRSNFLPTQATIIGVRFYKAGAGKGVFRASAVNGHYECDIPQLALLCRTNVATADATRRFTLRGLPDAQVTNGEFSPTPSFSFALQQFFLGLQGFGFYGQSTVPTYALFQIDATGLVTQTVPNVFAIGDLVNISQALDGAGKRISGQFRVATVGPLGSQYTLAGWTAGACTGGTALKKSKGFMDAGSADPTQIATVERVVTRRVGRPLELYRGRRSKKRKTA